MKAARELAEARSAELQKTLYASEMHLALAALERPGGAVMVKDFLDHWRPEAKGTELTGVAESLRGFLMPPTEALVGSADFEIGTGFPTVPDRRAGTVTMMLGIEVTFVAGRGLDSLHLH